tara:strand:+ start:16004 stop:16210 length:207 start_codon:yes stop_codon:yes gene_type:complete
MKTKEKTPSPIDELLQKWEVRLNILTEQAERARGCIAELQNQAQVTTAKTMMRELESALLSSKRVNEK